MVSFHGKLTVKIINLLLLQTLLLKVNQREKTIGYSANMSDYNWGVKGAVTAAIEKDSVHIRRQSHSA